MPADAVLGHAEVREPGDGGEVVELASLSGFAFDDRGSAGETRSLCFASFKPSGARPRTEFDND